MMIKDKKEIEEKEEEKDLNSASNDSTELVEMSTEAAAATKVETEECKNDDVTDVKKEKSTRSKK